MVVMMVRKMYESTIESPHHIPEVNAAHVHCFRFATRYKHGQSLNLFLNNISIRHYTPFSAFPTEGFRIKLSDYASRGLYDSLL